VVSFTFSHFVPGVKTPGTQWKYYVKISNRYATSENFDDDDMDINRS
jgi:hypothetical protein